MNCRFLTGLKVGYVVCFPKVFISDGEMAEKIAYGFYSEVFEAREEIGCHARRFFNWSFQC